MTPRLPPEIARDDFDAWVAALGELAGARLEAGGPDEAGAPVEANGDVIAALRCGSGDAPRAAARLLSLLAEDRIVRRDLAAQTARLWKEQNFLTSVATSLTGDASVEQTASRLLPRIVRLLGVGRASILLARPDGELAVAAAHGIGDALSPGDLVPRGGVSERVYRSGEPILVDDVERLPAGDDVTASLHRGVRSKSFVSVPVVAGGLPIGVINATDRTGPRPFHAEDLKLLGAIAAQAGIAFANVRLLAEAKRAEALKRELDLAAGIQRSLLPQGPFVHEGFDVYGHCEPAAWVGGDSFEISPRHGGGLWAAVLDVAGHGMSAALLAASARAALRALLALDPPPAAAAGAWNGVVQEDVRDSGLFLTASLARVDAAGRVRVTSLGHPPALLVRRDGSWERLGSGGAPAGVLPGETYEDDQRTLEPGDVLVLYTDGLSEAGGGRSEEELVAILAARPRAGARELAESLVADAYERLGASAVPDDVTIVVVRRPEAA